jgi:hypothetical protein
VESFAVRRAKKVRELVEKGRAVRAMGVARSAVINIQSHEDATAALEALTILRRAVEGTGRNDFVDDLIAEANSRAERYEKSLHLEQLRRRLVKVAEMLLVDVGQQGNIDLEPLIPFIATSDGRSAIQLTGLWSYSARWQQSLFDAYRRGTIASAGLTVAGLRDYQSKLKRSLKSLAVDLLARGGKVEGLNADAVPLVTYALLQGHLPVGGAIDPETTLEQSNDAVLAYADWLSRASAEDRVVFMQLFQIAFGVGVAEEYAKALSLDSFA